MRTGRGGKLWSLEEEEEEVNLIRERALLW